MAVDGKDLGGVLFLLSLMRAGLECLKKTNHHICHDGVARLEAAHVRLLPSCIKSIGVVCHK